VVEARFFAHFQTGRGAHQPPVQWVAEPFPGVQGPGRGVNHSPPSSAEIQEKVECTSTPALCLHDIL